MGQRPSIAGLVLIVLGVLFLLGQWMHVGGEGVVAMIGLALLAAYAFTRQYGFLVPGGIMTGLGIGIIYETRLQADGAPVLLGLGLGFISIYLISRLRTRMPVDWWPLIPGGILTVIGLFQAAEQIGWLGGIARWWPLVLILIGLYFIFRQRSQPGM